MPVDLGPVTAPRLDDSAPWRRRFRAPAVAWAQVAAAEPARGLVVSNRSGAFQLHAWDVPTGRLTRVTDRPGGLATGRIAPDGRHIYYPEAQEGGEAGHVVRVPFRGGVPEDLTPDFPPYQAGAAAVSRSGNLVAFTLATAGGREVYGVDVGPDGALGPPRSLFRGGLVLGNPVVSAGGEVVAVSAGAGAADGRAGSRVLAFEAASGRSLAVPSDALAGVAEPIAFSPVPGSLGLLAACQDRAGTRILLLEPADGFRADLLFEWPEGSVRACDWSPDGVRVVFMTIRRAVQRLFLYELGSRQLTPLEGARGVHYGIRFGPGGELLAVWEDAGHPPHLVTLDARTGARSLVLLPPAEVPACRPWRSVVFDSSDGQEVQGWLGVPEGPGPFPAVIELHGGPADVRLSTYAPMAEAWLDHGFAFLSVNYRGSVSFGQRFRDRIRGNPGHWELEDVVAARAWLVDEGVARPDQTFLSGWSYGGLLTLLALGKRPELWAGGMAGLAIADWAMNYEDSPEALKAWARGLFGGTPTEKPALYAACSPRTYAADVRAPVLLVHGRNDTRCSARQILAYRDALTALGKSVELNWVDSGHVLRTLDPVIAHQEAMLRFTHRILGTRGTAAAEG